MAKLNENPDRISRRKFFKLGGALAAGSAFFAKLTPPDSQAENQEPEETKIKAYRTLGRTGFNVSDISMGTLRVKEPNVIRYAYDRGVNYFDNAEAYQNGEAESKLGAVLKYMDRKKIFLTTKIHISEDESEESIRSRFTACQERMKTSYIDCFYMHAVKKVSVLDKPEFHAAVAQLKTEGRVRFAGLSSHGPSRDTEDSMEKVLCAAALDGRFDVMLLVYNFMNEKAGNTILKTCKEKNVGTTAMKTSPGVLSFEKYDPLNPTAAQKNHLQRLQQRYKSAEETEEKMREWVQEQQEEYDNSKPFIEKYKISSEEQLKIDSIRWVLSKPDMHAACISFVDFDSIDKIVPFSGFPLSEIETGYINWYKSHFNDQYCRHGCNMCMSECPHQIPVSTIMRYAYYFKNQNWEKESMAKYQRLGELNGTVCENCSGPCMQACEYKINIPAQLQAAHQLLTLT